MKSCETIDCTDEAVDGHVHCRAHLREAMDALAGIPDPDRARADMATWTPERRAAAARGLLEGHPGERPAMRPEPK